MKLNLSKKNTIEITFNRENSKNINQTWKGINNLLGNNLSTTSIKNIEYNNANYTTPDEIGNALNSHFTEIGPKLSSQLPTSTRQPSDYNYLSCSALLQYKRNVYK